jgi:hypothetical protein
MVRRFRPQPVSNPLVVILLCLTIIGIPLAIMYMGNSFWPWSRRSRNDRGSSAFRL